MNKTKHPQSREERIKLDKEKKARPAKKASGLRKKLRQVIEDEESKNELEEFTRS